VPPLIAVFDESVPAYTELPMFGLMFKTAAGFALFTSTAISIVCVLSLWMVYGFVSLFDRDFHFIRWNQLIVLPLLLILFSLTHVVEHKFAKRQRSKAALTYPDLSWLEGSLMLPSIVMLPLMSILFRIAMTFLRRRIGPSA